MAKTAMIRARTELELKRDVETIFDKLGLTSSEAINLFYHQVRLNQGLPFKVNIPNQETIQVFEETDRGKNVIRCPNAKDIFDNLGL